jgi:hypothetical protein
MLKELQKLGWKVPGRLHLLRYRFRYVEWTEIDDIRRPSAIRTADNSSLEEKP